MKLWLLIFSVPLILSGCFVGKGVVHTVGRGETFWRIVKAYDADPQEVAELNGLSDPERIKAGTRIFIPGATRVRTVTPYYPADRNESAGQTPSNHRKKPDNGGAQTASIEKEPQEKIVMEKWRFIWPVKGEVESTFGMRNGTRHDGLDIRAPEGTPIKAADGGRVIYSNSKMRGYGNLIIIKHNDDFYTVYAHNKVNNVKDGDKVSRGDVIGAVGSTGNATNAHLHFEVRKGKKVRNPIFFLP